MPVLTGGAAVAQQAARHNRCCRHCHHARHQQRGLPALGGVVGAAARHVRLGLNRENVGLAGRVVLSEAQGLWQGRAAARRPTTLSKAQSSLVAKNSTCCLETAGLAGAALWGWFLTMQGPAAFGRLSMHAQVLVLISVAKLKHCQAREC